MVNAVIGARPRTRLQSSESVAPTHSAAFHEDGSWRLSLLQRAESTVGGVAEGMGGDAVQPLLRPARLNSSGADIEGEAVGGALKRKFQVREC